jgi:putative redox protein
MTLRLYADRKGWPLGQVTVELNHSRVHARDCEECEEADNVLLDVIRKRITVSGDLDAEQIERLHKIADRCPVQRTLEGGVKILSELGSA